MASVEERIIQNVKSELEAVTISNGFSTDVQLVQRQQGDVAQLKQFPGVIIIHDGIEETNRFRGIIDAVLRLTILFGQLRADPNTWATDLSQFGADLAKKLREDYQRGSLNGNANARFTHVRRGFIGDSHIDGHDVTMGEIALDVTFGYLDSDPETAY